MVRKSHCTMTHYRPHRWRQNPSTQRFIFASGIECSYPTIETPSGRIRRDQLAECGHYDRWREDLQLTLDLGIHYLRYGPPYYRMHLGADRYDWSWTDEVMPVMRDMGIVPIVDLCHFGVPDWIGNFQNEEWPEHFADFARQLVRRYPWLWCFTPVNEMYITAEFSTLFGWWNERQRTHEAFVRAVKNVAKATVLAVEAIIAERADALFVLAESSETTHARDPELTDEAQMFNQRRFLALDLVCGKPISSGMYCYLHDNGMTEDEYLFFLNRQLTEHYIMGHDYYEANERELVTEEERRATGDVYGYYPIARHYYDRYNLPIIHTETNAATDCVGWLWKTWYNIQALRQDGIPLCGMTWYSLTHQVDWDTALREKNDRVYKVGLYDLDRNITPVGEAYRDLIRRWHNTPLLPNGPLTLVGEWTTPLRTREVVAEGRRVADSPPADES